MVARSTAETEYRAMANGVCEILWLWILLLELDLYWLSPFMLYCDNKAAIDIANNLVQHDRTKYIEINRYFIKEKLDARIICMSYVRSVSQLADILTKSLSSQSFSFICDKMGLYNIYNPS